jgi:hypothetical protein
VVDQLLLAFQPFRPAHATNFLVGFPAQIVLEGLECHPLAIQPTSSAVQRRHHASKIDVSGNVIQSIVALRERR